jgi:hypothetical protein
MPRQIIDTESSRPRYVRRIVLTSILVLAIVALLLILAFAAWGMHPHTAAIPGK